MWRNWPPSEDRGGMGPARSGVSPEMRRKCQNHESIAKKAEMEVNIVHFPFPPNPGHLVQTTQSLSFQSTTNAEGFDGTDWSNLKTNTYGKTTAATTVSNSYIVTITITICCRWCKGFFQPLFGPLALPKVSVTRASSTRSTLCAGTLGLCERSSLWSAIANQNR